MREARGLKEFLDEECAPFPPRSLRLSERKELVTSLVLLSRPDQAWAEGRRGATANVSAAGCFVVTFEDFRRGQHLWIAFCEQSGRPPLAAEVRWVRPWGTGPRMPGIGVRFLSPPNTNPGPQPEAGGTP